MKAIINYVVLVGMGLCVLLTMLTTIWLIQEVPLTCEEVEQKVRNFQECLTVGHACHVDGPDAFGEYHKMQDYLNANCRR